jgi:hypothetical protein
MVSFPTNREPVAQHPGALPFMASARLTVMSQGLIENKDRRILANSRSGTNLHVESEIPKNTFQVEPILTNASISRKENPENQISR